MEELPPPETAEKTCRRGSLSSGPRGPATKSFCGGRGHQTSLQEVLEEGSQGVDADAADKYQRDILRHGWDVDNDIAARDVSHQEAHELRGRVRGKVITEKN